MDQQLKEWRRQGIGGSDAPVIMEVSPWKTVYELWEEKALGVEKDYDNAAMKRGRDLEEQARHSFESMMNTFVVPQSVIHPKKSWLRANLDGIDPDGRILVEIKCPNKDDHFTAAGNKVPEKYYPQCQHQLAVTGLDGMYYFSFNGSKGIIVEVARDQKYIDEMLLKEEDFWSKVLTQTPPELSEKDRICMEGNKEWLKLSKRWQEIDNALKALERDLQTVNHDLTALSQGRSAKGGGISLTKSICKGQIDYKLAITDYLENMKSHYPHVNFPEVALEPYRKKSFTKCIIRSI